MKIKRWISLSVAAVLLLLVCACRIRPDAESGRGYASEEARMAELWDMTLSLAASLSAGQVTLTDIQTNMVSQPLASVRADGRWDHLTYASGETVSYYTVCGKMIFREGGEAFVKPEYLSPLEITALPRRVHLPDTSALRRALSEGAIPGLTPSDIVWEYADTGKPFLRTETYFLPFIRHLSYAVVYEGMEEIPSGFASLTGEMTYHPSTDTLTVFATWTDDSMDGSGVAHRFAVTVAPDAAHAGQMTLSWEHTQTEVEAVPYSSLTPTLTSTGRVTEWVHDANGLVSCTLEEERIGVCMDISLLGDSMMRTETHATVQTRLTPRESTVIVQTVEQRTVKKTPVGESDKNETLRVTVTARTDGRYDFEMYYETYRESDHRHFRAVAETTAMP